MHSFVIEQRPCGECQNQRTVRFGAVRFCFNCRAQAHKTAYPFTAAEVARLRDYRAAVRVGFYTDALNTEGGCLSA